MVRDLLVVREFMRADGDYFFSGVRDVYFSGSVLFCLSNYIYTKYSLEKLRKLGNCFSVTVRDGEYNKWSLLSKFRKAQTLDR